MKHQGFSAVWGHFTLRDDSRVEVMVFIKYDHITPVLASLHCLPVCFRIDFKIVLITFKALHSLSPCYISDLTHHIGEIPRQRCARVSTKN